MKTFWNHKLEYRENYNLFLDKLHKDDRPWITDQEPPKDGRQLYFLCQSDYMGDPQYDVGCWQDYTKCWWYDSSAEADGIEGGWNTDFGNCEQIMGWRLVL